MKAQVLSIVIDGVDQAVTGGSLRQYFIEYQACSTVGVEI